MKYLIVLWLLLIASVAFSGNVTLEWDANEEPDIIGYNIYWKNHSNEDYISHSELLEQDLDNPLFPRTTFWGLNDNLTYYFAATALTALDESAYSNEVIWTAPQPEPEPQQPNAGGGGGGCFINSLKK